MYVQENTKGLKTREHLAIKGVNHVKNDKSLIKTLALKVLK